MREVRIVDGAVVTLHTAPASAPSEGVERLEAAVRSAAESMQAGAAVHDGWRVRSERRAFNLALATLTSRVREVEEERDRAIVLLNERLPACERRASDLESRAARLEEERDRNRPFPVQLGNRGGRGSIPWWMAEEAYAVYSRQFGRSQSLERMGERGGFGDAELDDLIPGWRDRLDRVTQLQAEVARLSEARAAGEREVAAILDAFDRWEMNGSTDNRTRLGRAIAAARRPTATGGQK